MPYTMDFLEDEGILLIENSGEMNYELIVNQTKEAVEFLQKEKCKRTLSDCTSLTTKIEILEIYAIPKLYQEFEAPHGKMAILVSELSAALNDYSFFENVCVNRGWNVRIFREKNAALDWLKKN